MRIARHLCALVVLSLAACAEPEPAPVEPVATEEAEPEPTIALEPITYDEFSAKLPSGAGCSFETKDEELILVAIAPDESSEADAPAQAAFKAKGEVMVIEGNSPSSYEILTGGGLFTVEGGARIMISREQGEGEPDGEESVAWPAKLDLRMDGEHRVYEEGRWSCGS